MSFIITPFYTKQNMQIHPVLETDGLRVSRIRGMIERKGKLHEIYIYAPNGGALEGAGAFGSKREALNIPGKSVLKVMPDANFIFKPRIGGRVCLAFELWKPFGENIRKNIQIDESESNNLVLKFWGGEAVIYTDESRFLPTSFSKKSGWFTHAHKGSLIALGDVALKKARKGEVQHCHTWINEIYAVMSGRAHFEFCDGGGRSVERLALESGELLFVKPSKDGERIYHAINWLDVGDGRYYRHVSVNYPSFVNGFSDRVLLAPK